MGLTEALMIEPVINHYTGVYGFDWISREIMIISITQLNGEYVSDYLIAA